MSDLLESVRAALADRYRVEGLLGEGGMAIVYKAQDLKHDRSVALKVLRPELAAALGEERFTREIHIAARLQHPNILPLYDSGAAEGHLFFVMPFVEGESLRQRLDREKQLPLEDALRIGGEVADALAYSHEHGVVHRDIKPENIMLVGGHTLVADFGIAKAVAAAGGDRLTQTGMAIGTPLYMSPEQASGHDLVDTRSDMYSLACVIYEMLAGGPPFSGPTPMAVMARHTMDQVPSIRVVRHAVPEAVEKVIFRALEKTPADRYGTMSQFVAALRSGAQENSDSRWVPPSLTGARRGWRRTRWIGAALILIGIGLAAWLALRPRGAGRSGPVVSDAQAKRLAVLYFTTSQDSLRYVADAFTEGVIDQLRLVPGLDVVSRGGVASYRGSLASQDSIARALGAGTLVEGQVDPGPNGVQVTVELIDASSNAVFQRKGFAIRTDQVQASIDSVTQAVADFLRQRLGEEITLQSRRGAARSGAGWASLQRALVVGKRADSLARELGLTPEVLAEYQTADSLLYLARAADPQWTDPLIQLAGLAYQRSRMVGGDPVLAAPWIGRSLANGDSAVRLDPENPEALEMRGTAQYWGYLLRLYPDPAEEARRLASARADLEKAVLLDDRRASAWATLSHLHYQEGMGGRTEVLLAARRAYEEDAYLASADKVISRLFLASYDNGQAVDADRWCQEGNRRFPAASEFVECKLLLMTMRSATPDVPLAWRLSDSAATLAPKPDRAFRKAKGRIIMAAVLARAALSAPPGGQARILADSARRVLSTTPITAEVDPQGDLHMIGAFALVLLGDHEGAFRALREWHVDTQKVIDLRDTNWWFQPLADDPRYADFSRPAR